MPAEMILMPSSRPRNEIERTALVLAHTAYVARTVRLADVPLDDFTHLVASRQGLFVVNEERYARLADGFFFGLTLKDSSIYAFEACDLPRNRSARGRVIHLIRRGERIVDSAVVAEGLDNGCHQIDFVDDRLCVLDTYNQKVLRFSPDEKAFVTLDPLPCAAPGDWAQGYAHVNSLLQSGDRILLLLHNGAERTGTQSAIAVFDMEWRQVDLWPLPGAGCHDIAVLEDGTLLSCGSLAGELISRDGFHLSVSSRMTRGLSVGTDTIVVGASTFSSRRDRNLVPGTLTFMDRTYRVRSVLEIPSAPTSIRRLDGQDLTLSAFARRRTTLP